MTYTNYSKYKMGRYSREDVRITDKLTADNHLSNSYFKIYEVYGIPAPGMVKETEDNVVGVEHRITGTHDKHTLKDSEGRYLDIVVFTDGEDFFWENFIDYMVKLSTLKQGVANYRYGYVAGTMSPFITVNGMTSSALSVGYILWEKYVK